MQALHLSQLPHGGESLQSSPKLGQDSQIVVLPHQSATGSGPHGKGVWRWRDGAAG